MPKVVQAECEVDLAWTDLPTRPMLLTGDDTNASYDESSGKTLQKMVTLQWMSAKGRAAGVVQCLVAGGPGATERYIV